MKSDRGSNEIYKMLLDFNDEEMANKLYETIAVYLLFNYGDENVDLHHLLCIMPKKLCKVMNEKELLYEQMVMSIMLYKNNNNIQTGFNFAQYQKALDTYMAYDTNKKHVSKLKKKEQRTTIEDFKDEKSCTIADVISNIRRQKDIEIAELDNDFVKPHLNKRYGHLVAKIPYRKNYVADPSIYWLCECDCGQFVSYRAASLKHKKSCCNCSNMDNYIGQKHDSLECIDQRNIIKPNGKSNTQLKVKCECGSIKIMSIQRFKESKCCGHWCPMFAEKYHDMEKSSQTFKRLFQKGTNVAKIGRTETNKNSTTGYLGVYYHAKTDKYLSYITFRGKRENLGFYNLPETAYKVRLSAQKIVQMQFIEELEKDEFIQNNKYLKRLLEKVKAKLEVGTDA